MTSTSFPRCPEAVLPPPTTRSSRIASSPIFRPPFLHRDVESDLIGLALWPPNWFRLASSSFDRINLAAEYYDKNIFSGRTFGNLIEQRRKPYIIINATDMTLGRRFEFTQDQFDLLCSDLSTVNVATAVAVPRLSLVC